jgi:hypothetical protein
MAKAKVSKEFRSRFSEKLMDLGNLIAISLIFGPLVAGKEYSAETSAAGVFLTFLCYIYSYILSL